jgi:hypothetical protein
MALQLGKRKLPRRVRIAHGVDILVLLATQAALQEEAEIEDPTMVVDGLWCAAYGTPVFGTIMIDKKLNASQRWETYCHELIHAVNDAAAWYKDRPLAT